MTDAYATIKEWPKMLYRPAAAGGVEKRIFNAEADIPKGEGWTDAESAKAKAKPAPVVEKLDAKAKGDLERRLEQASRDNAELTNIAAKTEAALHDQLRTNAEQATKIADMTDFLNKIVASDAPEKVRAEANALLNPPPPPEPEPRKRKIVRKEEE